MSAADSAENRSDAVPTRVDTLPPLLAGAATLVVFLALCWAVRPQSDDYAMATAARAQGWLAAQQYYYTHWNGRFTATALQLAMGVGGDLALACRCCAALILGGFIAAGVSLVRALAPAAPRAATAVALVVAAGCCGTCVAKEGFYWIAGACTYASAATLMLLGGGLAVRAARGVGGAWTIAALPIVGALTAGCCETIVPLALVAIACGWFAQRRAPRAHLAWGALLLGLGVGALALVLAPGNRVRLGAVQGLRPLGPTALSAVSYAFTVTMSLLRDPAAIAGAALIAPLAAAMPWSPRWRMASALAAIGIGGVTLAALPALATIGRVEAHVHDLLWWWLWCWLAAAWLAACAAGAARPTSRVATGIAIAALVGAAIEVALGNDGWLALVPLALGALGFAAPVGRPRLAVRLVLALGFAGWCLRDAGPDLLLRAPRYRAVWQEREGILAAAHERGERLVVVPALPDDAYPRTLLLTDISPNPAYGWNRDLAAWYGVEEVWLDCPLPPDHPLRRAWERQVRERAARLGQSTLGGRPLAP